VLKKNGWTVKEPAPRGFQPKDDVFDAAHLPVVAAAPAKSSKKK
jgi:hypothetical protein